GLRGSGFQIRGDNRIDARVHLVQAMHVMLERVAAAYFMQPDFFGKRVGRQKVEPGKSGLYGQIHISSSLSCGPGSGPSATSSGLNTDPPCTTNTTSSSL